MTAQEQIAKRHGFARCFTLKLARFAHYEKRQRAGTLHPLGSNLTSDLPKSYPWANAILLLLYAYEPLSQGADLSGYYLASNSAYHASEGVINELSAAGLRAERCSLPVRECAMTFGLGTPLKNGLTCWGEFGSRAAVQTLVANLPEPVEYEQAHPQQTETVLCKTCHACENICPVGAITGAGFDCFTCLRGNIDGETLPDFVMEKLPSVLGCELCQYACPINAKIPALDIPLPEFLPETLLSGDLKGALALVGKNQNKGGRLIAHAAVIAANRNRTDLLPLVERWIDDERPLVRASVRWAAERLRRGKGPEAQSIR